MKKMVLILVAIVISFQEMASAASWTWVYSSDTIGWYIDTSSIKRCPVNYKGTFGQTLYSGLSSTHIIYWTKEIFEDELERINASKKFQKYSDEDYSDFYYLVVQEEADKVDNTIYSRNLYMVAYDFKGRVIETIPGPAPWGTVTPGSISEYIYDVAQEYAVH